MVATVAVYKMNCEMSLNFGGLKLDDLGVAINPKTGYTLQEIKITPLGVM